MTDPHSSDSPTVPLRRTRRDLIATGVIAAVAAVLVGGAWFTAPIRSANLETADAATSKETTSAEEELVDTIPTQLTEAFTAEASPLPGVHRPIIAAGLTVSHDPTTVRALDAEGNEVWSYQRSDREICSLGQAWGEVVVTFRSGVGCGDVVSLDAATGQYSGTRSAIAEEDPVALSSNDRVGIAGPNRVELWRSDMVRTVEYGEVEAKQEPDLQPNEECDITSALTRTELLAVTETCPDDPGTTMLQLQEATPDESREPELYASIPVNDPDTRLVAVGQNAAAVYLPATAQGGEPQLVSYDKTGTELARATVEPAPALTDVDGVVAPATGDLSHHMSWFDGQRLYLLAPETLELSQVIPDALGTGVAVGERLLLPVPAGIAVVDWHTGAAERVIQIDRGGYTGEVHLEKANGVLVEQRGDTLVGLTPQA